MNPSFKNSFIVILYDKIEYSKTGQNSDTLGCESIPTGNKKVDALAYARTIIERNKKKGSEIVVLVHDLLNRSKNILVI